LRFYPPKAYDAFMEFVRFATFDKSAARIFSESDILEIELALAIDPLAGDLIPGARGLRKLRRPLAGRGKRGGARVIYYFVTAQNTVLLLHAYAKNRASDLPKAFLHELADVVKTQFP
jgi:mRNA-degrading endonuclease RelE of RelBE toxin-antitoxin system